MSKTEKKQVALLTLITAFAQEKYFGAYSDELFKILEDGLQTYADGVGGMMAGKDFAHIRCFFAYMEKEIESREYNRSNVMMLSIIAGITAEMLTHITNPNKVSLWETINNSATSYLSKNFSNFTDELDKASEIVDLMVNYEF